MLFRSAEINKLLRAIWKQNLAVSLTMQRLIQDCPQVKTLPMDMIAMIYPLGLMHVIGIPVLAINFYNAFAKFVIEDLSRPLPEIYAREKEIFDGFDHFELGAEVLKRWAFPDFVPDIISSYHVPEPKLESQSRTLHSLLRFARHLAQEYGYAALPDSPPNFWLQGNVLDLSGVNQDEIRADVIEQLDNIMKMFQ